MRQLSSFFASAALLSAPAIAAPVVLVSESFDTTSTQLSYFGFNNGQPQVEDGVLKVPFAPNGRFATSNFTQTTLGVGDSLTVGFQLTATRQASPVDFRLGIYNSLGTPATDTSAASRDAAASDQGYLVTLRDDPGLFFSGVTQSDFTGVTLEGEVGGFNGVYLFADGQSHDVKYVFRNTGAMGFAVDLYFDGALRNTANTPGGVTIFDNLQFGFGNTALSSVQLDNLVVQYSVVPEPVTLTAMMAGLIPIARRRRSVQD